MTKTEKQLLRKTGHVQFSKQLVAVRVTKGMSVEALRHQLFMVDAQQASVILVDEFGRTLFSTYQEPRQEDESHTPRSQYTTSVEGNRVVVTRGDGLTLSFAPQELENFIGW